MTMQPINLDTLDFSEYIKSGDLVLWGQAQAEPVNLTTRLFEQRHSIGHFRVFLGINQFNTCQPDYTDCVEFISYCGAGNKALAQANKLQILPLHYSQYPSLFATPPWSVDVVLVQVSKPDSQGRYSYSLSQDYIKPAIENARVVIAEVNEQAPWVYSDSYLTAEDFDVMVHTNRVIAPSDDENNEKPTISDTNQKIANLVTSHIPDGATLQTGIGNLPEDIIYSLAQHKDIGIHSGVIGDAVAKLMQQGVITNRQKSLDTGKTVTGLIIGSTALHQFVHNNPDIVLKDIRYTHHLENLKQIKNFYAINSAIEVDLTGQINSEVANGLYMGAVGGALDFIRGANASEGGGSIIALPSSGKNFSRIVANLQGVVTIPRSDAGIIITEYGVADLRGLTLSQRVRAMLAISHPKYTEELTEQAKRLSLI